ncbi:MAG: carboxypeptidase-like regulatory domain-containing protein, partial [Bacteroidales bacterium]
MSFITSASSEVKIQGIVKDETGEPLIGVSVVVEGTTIGTITDFDGNYELAVPAGSKLVFSYIGYEAQSFKTDGKNVLNVVMREDSKNLEEVVVVGFGAQKKANLTGAVAQVKMADVLGDRPVVNAMSALQGTMPGLQISGGSGPGQSKSFNIRGTNSINGGSPLVLIDNVPGDIDMLNPEDIES